jgi:hypothetical protein
MVARSRGRAGRTEAGKRVVRRCRGIAWYADCEEYPRASFTVGIEVGKSGCSPQPRDLGDVSLLDGAL